MISSSSAPWPLPEGNAFAHPPVEGAEIVLHLAKVGQQLPRQLQKLLETILQRRVVQQRNIPRQNAGDLRVDIAAAFLQFGDPHLRIGLAPLAHLPQQLEQVSRRDSVPTKARSVSPSSQARAFSVAGVRSKCGSSVPAG
jgi:hypothetical protein